MRFLPTEIPGVVVLEQERHADARGYFARVWGADELTGAGLEGALSQSSVSFNHRRGTVRGMHYQAPPHAETKVVRCLRGAMLDVALDLRPDAPTFGRWVAAELTPENGRALYVPRGFGHGFYTLADDTEVEYLISAAYQPAAGRGLRHDDPLFDIRWPGPVTVIAERDRTYPLAERGQFAELQGL